jgi:hypothetical protein
MISYIRHGKDKSMDLDKLNEMSAEEKADYCQSILEKLGCLVIRPDEVYEEGEVEEVFLETKAEEPLMLEMETGEDAPLQIDGILNHKGSEYDFTANLIESVAEPIKLKK